LHEVKTKTRVVIKDKILLQDIEMTSKEGEGHLELSDIEELKRYIDDLTEMHEGSDIMAIHVTASFLEKAEYSRRRRYEAFRKDIIKDKEREDNEPL